MNSVRTHTRRVRQPVALLGAALSLVLGAAVAQPAAADPGADTPADLSVDVRQEPTSEQLQLPLELSDADRAEIEQEAPRLDSAPATRQRRAVAARTQTSIPTTGTGGITIGGTKIWFVLDQVRNQYVAYRFVLRALAPHVEVWVQENTDFPAGDCRNDGVRNVVTAADAEQLATQFEDTILPIESEVFSVAPGRDGSKERLVGNGSGYYTGRADSTVALIANIRDADFYTPNAPAAAGYTRGYFSPDLTEGFDRNLVTLDSYDWTHRSGANPPATTATCLPRNAVPRAYEATFAHEYQHLLKYYLDRVDGVPEKTWLNEGLSMYAETLTGYVDPSLTWPSYGASSSIACFQGLLTNANLPYCGPENSLTVWGDKGASALTADYGAVDSFMIYLADRFGVDLITRLHRDPLHGLASLDAVLAQERPRGLSATDVIPDWSTAVAVHAWIDEADGRPRGLWGNQARRFSSSSMHSEIDWTNAAAYATPGAPPNGSDYVLATDGRPVSVRTIDTLNFRGGESFTAAPGEPVVPVGSWNVQLIGWSSDHRVLRVADLPLNGRQRIRLTSEDLRVYLRGADRVGVIVTADDQTETATGYAPYQLKINGTLQPGG